MNNLATSTEPVYESALEKYSTNFVSDNWQIKETKKLSYVLIRGLQDDERFLSALNSLGLIMPEPMKITVNDNRTFIWVSPDEFLLVLESNNKIEFIDKANKAFSNMFAYVIDNSGSYTNLTISGNNYLDVMAKLSPYDYLNLKKHSALSTNLAKAPAIIFRSRSDSITILVRFSFADYLWRILENASSEYT